MKLKWSFLSVFALVCTLSGNAQYKDLEGVFFNKVIAFGVTGSVHSYSSGVLKSSTSITPVHYSVFVSNRTVGTLSFTLHKKVDIDYTGNVGTPNEYTKTVDRNIFEIQSAYKFALTNGGIDKPTSVFAKIGAAFLFGKEKVIDTRWGEEEGLLRTLVTLGDVGFSVFQRVGSRIIVFAEPTYMFDFTQKADKVYFEEENGKSKYLTYSNIRGQVGIMFLIGKKN